MCFLRLVGEHFLNYDIARKASLLRYIKEIICTNFAGLFTLIASKPKQRTRLLELYGVQVTNNTLV